MLFPVGIDLSRANRMRYLKLDSSFYQDVTKITFGYNVGDRVHTNSQDMDITVGMLCRE